MLRHLNTGDRYGTTFTGVPQLGRMPQDSLKLPQEDIRRLRALAQRKHQYAQEERVAQNRILWTAANDLKMTKPPIYINEICWGELEQETELVLECTHPLALELEEELTKELYCYAHNLGDLVVEDFIECPLFVYDSGFGIDEQVDIAKTDPKNDIVSRHFHILLENEDDIAKIKEPEIYLDEERTEQIYQTMCEIFQDVISVRKVGPRGLWFTPWDFLIRVMGVEETLINLYDEPEFVEATVKRYVDCSLLRARRYRELGIWASNNSACRVGSGGYGLTTALESAEGKDTHCDMMQMWGCGNAQIFSDVSPEMHWQFSLQYEMEWLKQFGMTYYGCCEPLFRKMDLMDKIPNLRKVSMSPWNQFELGAERCKGKYVMSCKPSPAIFAMNTFDEDQARESILDILEKTKGCSLELIMKDISTLAHDPVRLHRWAAIAHETVDSYYGC